MISEPIVLRPELQEELELNAKQEARSVNEVLNEALEYYFEARQEEKLNQEIAAYEKMHPELWQNFASQWVAIHNQELVDHDSDDVALHRRVRARYGQTVVLIRQVRETPIDEIWLRTPSTGRMSS